MGQLLASAKLAQAASAGPRRTARTVLPTLFELSAKALNALRFFKLENWISDAT